MLDTYVQAKIDMKTKDEAMKTLKRLGISISDYIRMAVIQLANKKAIPFEASLPKLTVDTIEKCEKGDELNYTGSIEDLFKQLNK